MISKNLGTNDCCTYINISSTGVASKDYSMMMGRYKKFSTDRLGVSSYKRGIYILYKYYAGSTHTTWLVSFGLSIKKRYFPSLIAVLLVENSKKQPHLFLN